MTLLNVDIRPDRITAAADSALFMPASDGIPERKASSTSKILLVPHLRGLVSGRGSFVFVVACYTAILNSGMAFDEMVPKLGQLFEKLYRDLKNFIGDSAPADFDRQQIVVAGFSTGADRMKGFLATQTDEALGFEVQEIETTMIAPNVPEVEDVTDLTSHTQMIELAHAQAQWGRDNHPEAAFGGAIEAMTGSDIAAEWRGTYIDADGGKALLEKLGGIETILRNIFGDPLTTPLLASRGDLATIETFYGSAMGVVTGKWVAVVTPDEGLGFVPAGTAKAVWSIR